MFLLGEGENRKRLFGVTFIPAFSASTTASLPAGTRAGDIAYYCALSSGNSGPIGTPSGFTVIESAVNTAGADTVIHASYKILNGTESSFTLTESTNGTVQNAVFVVVRGFTQHVFSDSTKLLTSTTYSYTMNSSTFYDDVLAEYFIPQSQDGYIFVGITYSGTWSLPVGFTSSSVSSGELVGFYINQANGGDGTTTSATLSAGSDYQFQFFVR